jgi:hypothetical protein
MDREAEPRLVYPLSKKKKWSKPSNLCEALSNLCEALSNLCEALPRETVSRAKLNLVYVPCKVEWSTGIGVGG